jgi:signal transduction histidine kinase
MPTSRGSGLGLQGMQERALLVGGTFQAGATQEGAFAITAWLPWTTR